MARFKVFGLVFLLGMVGAVSPGMAQETAPGGDVTAAPPAESEAPVADAASAESEASAEGEAALATAQKSLAACQDGLDNDGDGLVDCDDPDCQIYAICVQPSPTLPVPVIVSAPAEVGAACRDGIDNDGNGLIDCQEPACQATKYCKKQMYERPTPQHKTQGFVINTHLGLALPNFHWKDVRGASVYGDSIPFDPDIGWSIGLKLLAVPVRWLGVGLNLRGGFTYASNRQDFISVLDDPNEYKYDGIKTFGHLGGVVRLQVPVRRVVPYVDIAFGYSAVRYHWYTYNARHTWEDIGGWWEDNGRVAADEVYRQGGHFTLALEPGVDAFVIERRFAVGGSLWIPVLGTEGAARDNIGLLFNFTFTPTWAEPKQLKPAYEPYIAR